MSHFSRRSKIVIGACIVMYIIMSYFNGVHYISKPVRDSRVKLDIRQTVIDNRVEPDIRRKMSDLRVKPDISVKPDIRQTKSDPLVKPEIRQTMSDRSVKPDIRQIMRDRSVKPDSRQIMSDRSVKPDIRQTISEHSVKPDIKQIKMESKGDRRVNLDIRNTSCDRCFPHNFDYLMNNKNICKNGQTGLNIDLFIMIFTRHDNFDTRHAIRQTWLKIANNNTANVRYVFLLGKVENKQLSDKVVQENEIHKDIIKEDFLDSYRNQTIKTIMGFKWVVKHCRAAKFVMKADDDTFVNIPNLLTYIRTYGANQSSEMIGSCRLDGSIRDVTSKWYASVQEYKESLYPWHCSGTGYLTSFKMAEKIYEISPNVPFFWLEDIYVSLCFMKIGGKVKHLSGFHRSRVNLDPCIYKGKYLYTSHEVPPKMMLKVWNDICTDDFI